MFPCSIRTLALVFGVTLLLATTAIAQQTSSGVGRPKSDVGGFAGNEMRNIYREGVGQGFTSRSLQNLDMATSRDRVPYVGQSVGQGSISSGGGGASLSLAPRRSSKPFSNISSSPTVSPYLNLFREDLDGMSDLNYHTLVRPQFQQLQTNQRLQDENLQLNRRVQAISAQSDYKNQAGSESLYPTGHQTAFGYHGRYYPGMNVRRPKQQ